MKKAFLLISILILSVIATLVWQINIAKGQVVTDGLVSYWSFDEIAGETVKDGWGENDGTIMGTPQIVDGKVGKALDVNGSEDYVNCGNDSSLRIARPLSIEFWFKALRETFSDNIIALTDGTKTNYMITSYQNTDRLSFIREDAADANSELHSSTAIDKNWHHVAAVDDGNTFLLYLDGDLDCSRGFFLTAYTLTGTLYIAQSSEDWATNKYFKGLIDEVRVYNRALSEDEVNQNMNAEGLGVVNSADKLPLSWGKIKVFR